MEIGSLTEELLFTVFRIEVRDSKGQSIGTGFIFNYEVENKSYFFLVTNKHVLSDAKEGLLTFIKGDGQRPLLGESYRLKIDNFQSIWKGHKSENVDVAISPFVPILNHISKQGVQIFFKAISNKFVPSEEILKGIDAAEDILFIGYPVRLLDTKTLIPVVRRGITATPAYLDFRGEKQFLIDASVFPGSSGSLVFIYNAGIYWDKKSKSTAVGHRFFFLGILSSVFQMLDTGDIIIPTENTPFVKINQLVDLGVVFKAETIVEAIKELLKTQENRATPK